MIRVDDYTRHVGHDQTDESDGAADGYADADECGYSYQHHQFDFLDIYANVTGIVFSNGKAFSSSA